MRKLKIIPPATKFVLMAMASLLAFAASAGKLRGKVMNASKEAVAGATVAANGSNIAVMTDNNGFFTLDWPKDSATLSISCVGFETREHFVGNGAEMVIITLLASSASLADVEVVSTGYQNIPRERASGSFVKVDNATLNQQAGTNILKRLDGVTSGLMFNTGKSNSNPQNTTNISIRGLSTINGPLDPLVVLDGFIYEGNITNVNPNDVDNITVLKDAAAASIWGARAGNGVIVITTKKARFGQKPQLSASANIILTEKPDLYSLPQMSSKDYIGVEESLFNKGYFDWLADDPSSPLTPAVEIFLARRNGLISPADSAAMSDILRNTDSRDQYLRYFYRKALTQQYAVGLRGGSDRNNYLFSAAYDNTLGETYSRDSKLNLRLENSFRPVDKLQLDVAVYYTASHSAGGRNVTYGSIQPGGRPVPYTRFVSADGTQPGIAQTLRGSYTDTAGGGLLLDWKYYPLEDYKYTDNTTDLRELYARLGLKYKPYRWLDLDIAYQHQRQQSEDKSVSGAGSFAARSLINLYSQVDQQSGTVTRIVPAGGIREDASGMTSSQTLRGQANFHFDRGGHSVAAIAGGEVRQASGHYTRHTLYGYQADPLSFTPVDFVNYYPDYVYGGYDVISGAPYSSGQRVNRFASLYGNASYTLKRRYTVTGSVRKDGSNLFGVTTNDRWKPLWSAGVVWHLSSEAFYKAGILPQLTVRVTYGHSGNVDLSRTADAVGIYNTTAATTGLPYTRVQTLNNPSLKWEQSGMLNMGVDFSLRGGRLSGSLEYYLKKGTDLYGSTPYDYTGWGRTSTVVRNIAAMAGRGADIILNSRNITGRLTWSTTLLLSYNSSRTTKYESASANLAASMLGGGTAISPQVGNPLYAIAAYRWAGLDSLGNPQGYLAGVKSTDYRAIGNEARTKGTGGNIVYVGPASPVFFGSLSNSLSFGGLTVTANIGYKGGYWFRKSTIGYASLVSSGVGHSDYSKRWQHPGDEYQTNVPSFIYPAAENRDAFFRQSEVNVLKGDHLRLQFINIGYNFPRNGFLGKKGQLQAYLNLANPGIIWRANQEGLDPDYPSSVRPPKSWTAGFRATF